MEESMEGAIKAVEEQLERAGFVGQRSEDAFTRFLYWLHPPLKKERDLLIAKVQDLTKSKAELAKAHFTCIHELRQVTALLDAQRQAEPRKIQRAATPAEVRRLTEQAFQMEEGDVR